MSPVVVARLDMKRAQEDVKSDDNKRPKAIKPSCDCIKSFELFKVKPRWLLLRLETEAGVVGWGEPNCEGGHMWNPDRRASAVRCVTRGVP